MGLQQKKLRFVLEKLGSKTTYTLSEIWNLANLFETVKSTVTLKNTIPQDGYTLFSRKESTRNQEICEIGKESNTSSSDGSDDEDENEFLNYMASKFDQGKLRKFRRNYRHQNWKRQDKPHSNRVKQRYHEEKNRDKRHAGQDSWKDRNDRRVNQDSWNGRTKKGYKDNSWKNKQQRTYRNNKMTGNDRKENSEKYRKERNREINQMADTEEREELQQSENEESEREETSETEESSSSEDTFEINCIGEEDNDGDTDDIAVANEEVVFKKPKTKMKIEKDPNIYEPQRRKNAIELEIWGNVQ